MANKAYITPEVLKWARLSSKLSQDAVASKLSCTVEKIDSWEMGSDYPTVSQATKLSEIYRRPLGVFYLPAPPKEFQTLRDFRGNDGNYNTALTFLMREIQEKQNWTKEFLVQEGEAELPFVGKFNQHSSPIEVANDIRSVLKINLTEKQENPLKYWIQKAEAQRIFICLTSNLHSHLKIDPSEAKGFIISDSIAPFIYINSGDTLNAQLFTLVHELAHLWLNCSGVSNIDLGLTPQAKQHKYEAVELLCNEIAAETLMPLSRMSKLKGRILSLEFIDKYAKEINVSSFALTVRLFNIGLISRAAFFSYKRVFDKRFEEFKNNEKKQSGGPNYYTLQIRKNGRAFSHLVYDSYKGGKISGNQASSLLGIKLNNFGKFESFLFK